MDPPGPIPGTSAEDDNNNGLAMSIPLQISVGKEITAYLLYKQGKQTENSGNDIAINPLLHDPETVGKTGIRLLVQLISLDNPDGSSSQDFNDADFVQYHSTEIDLLREIFRDSPEFVLLPNQNGISSQMIIWMCKRYLGELQNPRCPQTIRENLLRFTSDLINLPYLDHGQTVLKDLMHCLSELAKSMSVRQWPSDHPIKPSIFPSFTLDREAVAVVYEGDRWFPPDSIICLHSHAAADQLMLDVLHLIDRILFDESSSSLTSTVFRSSPTCRMNQMYTEDPRRLFEFSLGLINMLYYGSFPAKLAVLQLFRKLDVPATDNFPGILFDNVLDALLALPLYYNLKVSDKTVIATADKRKFLTELSLAYLQSAVCLSKAVQVSKSSNNDKSSATANDGEEEQGLIVVNSVIGNMTSVELVKYYQRVVDLLRDAVRRRQKDNEVAVLNEGLLPFELELLKLLSFAERSEETVGTLKEGLIWHLMDKRTDDMNNCAQTVMTLILLDAQSSCSDPSSKSQHSFVIGDIVKSVVRNSLNGDAEPLQQLVNAFRLRKVLQMTVHLLQLLNESDSDYKWVWESVARTVCQCMTNTETGFYSIIHSPDFVPLETLKLILPIAMDIVGCVEHLRNGIKDYEVDGAPDTEGKTEGFEILCLPWSFESFSSQRTFSQQRPPIIQQTQLDPRTKQTMQLNSLKWLAVSYEGFSNVRINVLKQALAADDFDVVREALEWAALFWMSTKSSSKVIVQQMETLAIPSLRLINGNMELVAGMICAIAKSLDFVSSEQSSKPIPVCDVCGGKYVEETSTFGRPKSSRSNRPQINNNNNNHKFAIPDCVVVELSKALSKPSSDKYAPLSDESGIQGALLCLRSCLNHGNLDPKVEQLCADMFWLIDRPLSEETSKCLMDCLGMYCKTGMSRERELDLVDALWYSLTSVTHKKSPSSLLILAALIIDQAKSATLVYEAFTVIMCLLGGSLRSEMFEKPKEAVDVTIRRAMNKIHHAFERRQTSVCSLSMCWISSLYALRRICLIQRQILLTSRMIRESRYVSGPKLTDFICNAWAPRVLSDSCNQPEMNQESFIFFRAVADGLNCGVNAKELIRNLLATMLSNLLMKGNEVSAALLHSLSQILRTALKNLFSAHFASIYIDVLLKYAGRSDGRELMENVWKFMVNNQRDRENLELVNFIGENEPSCITQLSLHVSENPEQILMAIQELVKVCNRHSTSTGADVIRSRFFRILNGFQAYFNNAQPLDRKIRAMKVTYLGLIFDCFKSLSVLIELSGGHLLDTLRFKVMELLSKATDGVRTAACKASDDQTYTLCLANCWLKLAQCLTEGTMLLFLPEITLTAMPVLKESGTEALPRFLFHTFIKKQPADKLRDYHDFCSVVGPLPEYGILLSYIDHQPVGSVTQEMSACLRLLNGHTQGCVIVAGLSRLLAILKEHKQSVNELLLSSSAPCTVVSDLMSILLRTVESRRGSARARWLAAECFGEFGAVDPGRMGMELSSPALPGHAPRDHRPPPREYPNFGIICQARECDWNVKWCASLLERLTQSLLSTVRNTDNCAFAIQDMLRATKLYHKSGFDEQWKWLNGEIRGILEPFIDSKYRFLLSESRQATVVPQFAHTTQWEAWISNWLFYTIPKLNNESAREIFKAVSIWAEEEPSFALEILPHVIVHGLLESSDDFRARCRGEITEVLNPSNLPHKLRARNTVFTLLDYLEQWKMAPDDAVGKLTPSCRKTIGDFLLEIPHKIVWKAAEESEDYTRALLYFERSLHEIGGRSTTAEDFAILQRLHHALNDNDSVAAALIRLEEMGKARWREKIRYYESRGDLAAAIPLYQQPKDVQTHLQLFRSLLRLNQNQLIEPYLLKLENVIGNMTNKLNYAVEDELKALQVEALWKLEKWDELDGKLNHSGNNDNRRGMRNEHKNTEKENLDDVDDESSVKMAKMLGRFSRPDSFGVISSDEEEDYCMMNDLNKIKGDGNQSVLPSISTTQQQQQTTIPSHPHPHHNEAASANKWSIHLANILLQTKRRDTNVNFQRIREDILNECDMSGNYEAFYGTAVQLHILSELETAHRHFVVIPKNGSGMGDGMENVDFGRGGMDSSAVVDVEAYSGTLPPFIMQDWNYRIRLLQVTLVRKGSVETAEKVLEVRRCLIGLNPRGQNRHELERHRAQSWLESAKVALSADHLQTAYGYIVQAKQASPNLPHIVAVEAKYHRSKGEIEKGIKILKRGLTKHCPSSYPSLHDPSKMDESQKVVCAKMGCQLGEYMWEAGAETEDNIQRLLHWSVKTSPSHQAYYALGRFIDTLLTQITTGSMMIVADDKLLMALEMYAESLRHGTPHTHHSLTRFLTLWLDNAAVCHKILLDARDPKKLLKAANSSQQSSQQVMAAKRQLTAKSEQFLRNLAGSVLENLSRLNSHQIYPAFSHLISRIMHPCPETFGALKRILSKVVMEYPERCLWLIIGVYRSESQEKAPRCQEILRLAVKESKRISGLMNDMNRLSALLTHLTNHNDVKLPNCDVMDMSVKFPKLFNFFNQPNSNSSRRGRSSNSSSKNSSTSETSAVLGIDANSSMTHNSCILIPIESQMDLKEVTTLERIRDPIEIALSQHTAGSGDGQESTSASCSKDHRKGGGDETVAYTKWNDNLVYIRGFERKLMVMSSIMKPKRIVILGSDGKRYPMMLKPGDDLRKDRRLMEFNAAVNTCLRQDSQGRRRQLHVRTYSVIPLADTGGLIEWVDDLVSLRSIIFGSLKKRYGSAYVSRSMSVVTASVKDEEKVKKFKESLNLFKPVMGDWLRMNFSEPQGWYAARMGFARTTAVMSMVGFVLGLGDRHTENILLDYKSGHIFHVDFNLLFNKGESLKVPEIVPFRLTQNLVDGMGALGVDGTFRPSSQIALKILRSNKEMLISVLESFLHDPLLEWSRIGLRTQQGPTQGDFYKNQNQKASGNLDLISRRLSGYNVSPRVVKTKGFVYGLPLNVQSQVEKLIEDAVSENNLARMYEGWMPWI